MLIKTSETKKCVGMFVAVIVIGLTSLSAGKRKGCRGNAMRQAAQQRARQAQQQRAREAQQRAQAAQAAAEAEKRAEKEAKLREAVQRRYNTAEICELLAAGIEIDARDDAGRTALHFACTQGCAKNISLLIEKGASLKLVDRAGNTPLHYAAECSCSPGKALAVLLRAGADRTIKNAEGDTPFHKAVKKGNAFIAYALSHPEGVIAELSQEYKDALLVNAVANSNCCWYGKDRIDIAPSIVEIVSDLIHSGAHATVVGENGETLLHKAIASSAMYYVEGLGIVEALVRQGKVDVNAVDRTGKAALHLAAAERLGIDFREKLLQALLDLGALVGLEDGDGLTPLHVLLRNGDETDEKRRCAQILIDRGADVNAEDKNGCTPLHLLRVLGGRQDAAETGELIAFLVERGANVNARNNREETPLHYACDARREALVGSLLTNGADANARNVDGQTPLGKIDFVNNVKKSNKLMRMLLSAGGQPTLESAVVLGDTNLVERIVSESGPGSGGALLLAVAFGHELIVRMLFDAGARVAGDAKKFLPLVAASTNFASLFRQCFLHGFRLAYDDHKLDLREKPNYRLRLNCLPRENSSACGVANKEVRLSILQQLRHSLDTYYLPIGGSSRVIHGKASQRESSDEISTLPLLLHAAAAEGWADAVALLLQHKWAHSIDSLVGDGEKASALHFAVRNFQSRGEEDGVDYPRVLRLLAESNANFDLPTSAGRTALHVAVDYDKPDAIHLLCALGANPNVCTEQGISPLSQAFFKQNAVAAQSLIKNGAVHDWCSAVESGEVNVLYRLLQEDAEGMIEQLKQILDGRTFFEGETLAHRAAARGHVGAIQFLTDQQCALEARDSRERTPLHIAALHGHADVVQFLLRQGIKVDVPDKWNATPLYLAVEQNHAEVALLLKNAGADVVYAGKRPLHVAMNHRNAALLRLLMHNIELSEEQKGALLRAAAEHGNDVGVKLLLDAGAQVCVAGSKESVLEIVAESYLSEYGEDRRDMPMGVTRKINNHYLDCAELMLEAGAQHTLRTAVLLGNAEQVVSILEHKETATEQAEFAELLSFAATCGHLDVVAALISSGAPVCVDDYKNSDDYPLLRALMFGHNAVADYLLQHGAEHIPFSAALAGNTEQLKRIVSKNEDGDDRDGWYLEALSRLRRGDAELLETFKDEGFDYGDGGDAMVHFCAEVCPLEIVHKIVKSCVLGLVRDDRMDKISDFLRGAVKRGQTELAKILCEKYKVHLLWRADANKETVLENETLLQLATKDGNEELVRYFLSLGEDPTAVSRYERETPLLLAQGLGHSAIVELLKPVSLSTANFVQLHEEQHRLREECRRASDGYEYLLHGAEQEEFAREVRDREERITYVKQAIAAEVARRAGEQEEQPDESVIIAHQLVQAGILEGEQRGAWGHATELHQIVQRGDLTETQSLINGLSAEEAVELINAPDENGYTALHYAARQNLSRIVRFLISHGAFVNARALHGKMPIHEAVATLSVEAVGVLCKKGADLTVTIRSGTFELHGQPTPMKGWTALHVAALSGEVDSVTVLLESGADKNTRDCLGRTAYDLAIAAQNSEVARLLEIEPEVVAGGMGTEMNVDEGGAHDG